MKNNLTISRRKFLETTGYAAFFTALMGSFPLPSWAQSGDVKAVPTAKDFDLTIAEKVILVNRQEGLATAINGTVPGPLLRLREGDTVTLRVHNGLATDSSIHWHGILLPPGMDGVPNVSFPGIKPGESFAYKYKLVQSGTYWYHSHSGFQEQTGTYGPMIVEPAEPDPVRYDRDYVVMLGDWMFADPHEVFAKLKKMSDYDNFQKRTVFDFFKDVSEDGLGATLDDRMAWGAMRMDPTDIADITGHTYTYLMNGKAPGANWTGLFRPGEKIRLRFINAAAMSYFDVRIPGLKMTVVQTDGQNIQPVSVDEFRIGVAETYDVIVEPEEDKAYTLFAEASDRSGYARGTLAPRPGMMAAVPAMRSRPVRKAHKMNMGGMKDMKDMKPMEMDHAAMGHTPPGGMKKDAPLETFGGPGVIMTDMQPTEKLDEPGLGLGNDGRRVLVYRDLRSLKPARDMREPEREVALHLTGNMERYIWSFDGKKFSEVKGPIQFKHNERLRLTLINRTMMDHPIHLHGMWMELENGAGAHRPFKHTLNIKSGEKMSALVTPIEAGDWAFHCHFLFHMEAGMFRVVSVT